MTTPPQEHPDYRAVVLTACIPERKPAHPRDAVLRLYRMTAADYDAMWDAQDGCCAICGMLADAVMAVDHDHVCCDPRKSKQTCGKCARQLLCMRCNTVLGRVEDNAELLLDMAAYLEKWNGKEAREREES